MADKGFHIKVLIPTDDGLSISEQKIEDALYLLMYNVSDRSYQLAGKIKVTKIRGDNFKQNISQLLIDENIDVIVFFHEMLGLKVLKPELNEINGFLNSLIDRIDQKKEL